MENDLKDLIYGEVDSSEAKLEKFSEDASIFKVRPQIAVAPKSVEDLKKLVKYVSTKDSPKKHLSLTVRSAGTDMSGGPLTDSIVVDMNRHFNKIVSSDDQFATAEPGVFYRDFEKETLRHNRIVPSYPASRELCTIGGMVANNSGGEKTFSYGKTDKYIAELKVVLSDGNEYVFKPLNQDELEIKLQQQDFEGEIYRKMHQLLLDNKELIKKAKPPVSKNSAGYALWDIIQDDYFDLTKLIVGSQGTLGIVTQIKFRLIEPKPLSKMLIIFLKAKDMPQLADIAETLREQKPESIESYDDNTFRLAIKFFPELLKVLKPKNILTMWWHLLPEFWILFRVGMPKLVIMAEFTSNKEVDLEAALQRAKEEMNKFCVRSRITKSKDEQREFWVIRRESFNLLRNKIKDKHTAPFIDDIIINPHHLNTFLPQLRKIIDKYQQYLIYTVAAHIGDGNFHIIPLMNLENPQTRAIIPKLADEVYALVNEFNGSITAEHNDGLVRSHYLRDMYGDAVVDLFKQTKQIFDPQNIFNPGKKVNASKAFALSHIKQK